MKSNLLSILLVIAAFFLPMRTRGYDGQLHRHFTYSDIAERFTAQSDMALTYATTAQVGYQLMGGNQDGPRLMARTVGLPVFDSGARESHLVKQFSLEFPDIKGEGITAVIFGPGRVRATHVEFRLDQSRPNPNRILVRSRKPLDKFSTYLAGVIGAQGQKPEAKGMAPAIKLINEDLTNYLAKLRILAPSVQIATHSPFKKAGWDLDKNTGRWSWWGNTKISEDEDPSFGKYGPEESQLDGILNTYQHLLLFAPAGNDRNDGPDKQPVLHRVKSPNFSKQTWVNSNTVRKIDGANNGGFDTLLGLGLAKNAVCVGSIDDVTLSNPISSEEYSGWGLADDGRIKPDLVSNGYRVISSSSASDNAYYEDTGTSTASAAAAGIGALLIELLQKTRPELMSYSAAVIKAVLIHTATDDRRLRGPDAKFGWGSINALKAGRVISKKVGDKFHNFIEVAEVSNDPAGKRKGYEFEATGDPIRVTLVWIDPPGPPNTKGLDDATPALQNDLDVKLTDPNGQVFYPYRLDRASPLSQAKRDGPNRVDNVEVIDAIPSQGKWKVEVAATSIRQGSSQRFALVVSGLN